MNIVLHGGVATSAFPTLDAGKAGNVTVSHQKGKKPLLRTHILFRQYICGVRKLPKIG
ncbi:MAG: hypothetical protein LBP25_03760 [Tannerellaceae bacterium]|nr:hypothetical protein [Tannerellaceae bacterium]